MDTLPRVIHPVFIYHAIRNGIADTVSVALDTYPANYTHRPLHGDRDIGAWNQGVKENIWKIVWTVLGLHLSIDCILHNLLQIVYPGRDVLDAVGATKVYLERETVAPKRDGLLQALIRKTTRATHDAPVGTPDISRSRVQFYAIICAVSLKFIVGVA